jgi:hypothetical protein
VRKHHPTLFLHNKKNNASHFKPYNPRLFLKLPASMRTSVFVFLLATALFSQTCFAVADDDDKPEKAANQAATPAEPKNLELTAKSLQLAGIKTQVLSAVSQQSEFIAFGVVVSLEPLLQLRQQYLAAHAQQDSAKAKYTEAHLNLSRTENLHHQDLVSTRRLQEQQAQWQADKANLEISHYQQQTILAASRLEWGETLTNWFVSTPQKPAEQFLQQKAQLLQITLPAGFAFNQDIKHIYIDEHGHHNTAIKAALISASPRVDPVSQGERYFFRAEGRHIPSGSHITAWISNQNQAVSGVIIPASALVWHLGQPWVFVKTAENQYNRRSVPEYHLQNNGYFVTGYLHADEEIVITGAQTLLSQQLKALIPDEDKD